MAKRTTASNAESNQEVAVIEEPKANGRKPQVRLTDSQKQEVLAMLSAGQPTKTIAEHFGTSLGPIIAIKNNVKQHPDALPIPKQANDQGQSPLHWSIFDLGLSLVMGKPAESSEIEAVKAQYKEFEAKHLRDLSRLI